MDQVGNTLEMVRRSARLVRAANLMEGQPLLGSDQLDEAVKELECLQAKLSSRWVADDPESLEYLVAEELTPPAETLKALAASHPPPQAWYDEE